MANLRKLVQDEERSAGKRGAIARVAKRIGPDSLGRLPDKYISQLLAGFQGEKDRQPRAPGAGLCARIEAAYGMPAGWMDEHHEQEGTALTVTSTSVAVPVFEVAGSMGVGRPQPENDTIAGQLMLTGEWVRTHLPTISAPQNLSVISAYGDSMAPTFSDGDLLLIDRGVNQLRLDAVYVASLNGDLYIKRLQRRPDGTALMLSDNPTYQPIVITNGERDDLHVLGRVVWAWNGRKM